MEINKYGYFVFRFEHILLPRGLKMISDSEPLLNYPCKSDITFIFLLWNCIRLWRRRSRHSYSLDIMYGGRSMGKPLCKDFVCIRCVCMCESVSTPNVDVFLHSTFRLWTHFKVWTYYVSTVWYIHAPQKYQT